MKGDFSRRTFDATRHYSAVLVEQGRLLTDADSEEEHRILTHRTERATEDVVGACGGPQPTAGFALSAPGPDQLLIGAGRYYADGTLLENESQIAFPEQPDRFDPTWPPAAGRHAVVLHSWRRLITALDDASIREVALGGPTTSSRERVVWQIDTVAVADDWNCTDDLPEVERTTGELAARAEPVEELTSPCLIPPQAGYTGLENQFYRVEIFDSGDAYDLQAAPETVAVEGFPAGQPNRLTVAALGPLAVGDAVEVFRSGPGFDPVDATFGYITAIDGTTLTLSTALPAFGPTDAPRARRAEAAFVVSRDNGSVVTTVEAIDGAEVTVHDLGPDDVLGFAVGQLVELSDDRTELENLPRQLRQIADVDTTRRVVVLRTPADPLDPDPSGVDPARHPKLRRWDGAGAVRFHPDGTAWIHLENGIQVRFVDGHYRRGDHWTFPARAAEVATGSGTIEWPQDGGVPALRFPFGIERHRCVLGYVDLDAAGRIVEVEDCRDLFPPVTAMRNLLYVGGDGQEGSPTEAVGGFIPLPGRLSARVANGGLPVEGAMVHFTITQGAGRLEGGGAGVDVDLATDVNGLVTCQWDIADDSGAQACEAQLLAPSGDPIPHQIVRYQATIDRDTAGGRAGCCLSVGPGGDYPTLDEALGDLLRRGEPDICLCLMPGDHSFGGGDFGVETERRVHLSVRGCGRATRMRMNGSWRLRDFSSVRLTDVDVLLPIEGSVTFSRVGDVELRRTRISGMPIEVALVRVFGCERLQVVSNVLVSRTRGALDGPRRFFDGLDPLTSAWDVVDEEDLRISLVKTARALADLGPDPRQALVAELLGRLGGPPDDLSRGELDAFRRLTDSIRTEEPVAGLLRELDWVVHAALTARPGVALEVGGREHEEVRFAARASVHIADNLVPGIITFYGPTDIFRQISDDALKSLESNVGTEVDLFGIAGEAHLRDNRFVRLSLGHLMIDFLESLAESPITSVYESFHVTSNVIDGVISEMAARHTAMTANEFTLDGLPPRQRPANGEVGHVVGDTAAYTGNHARTPSRDGSLVIRDVTRASAEAANLELQIT
ncbi:DUF6519 domain-containing protein [Geodermatophilus sp. SYSU D01180]